MCVCVCAREGFVVGVVHRMGVELLKYFLYHAGGIGCVLMHAGGVGGGVSFFAVDLSGCEVLFEVTLHVLSAWSVVGNLHCATHRAMRKKVKILCFLFLFSL